MTNQEQREIIQDAIRLIENGWCQGNYRKTVNGIHCVCMGEAISLACTRNHGPKYMAVIRLVSSIVDPNGYLGISAWNDQKGRTKEEVISALQSADAKLNPVGWQSAEV